MLCDALDLPDDLVAAQEQERLVILAGAGVSMGPPAYLPNFRQLAERIAENTGCQPEAPYDQFLGKLADDAVDVHTLCRDIIRDSGSSPNPLHRSLLHLFRE